MGLEGLSEVAVEAERARIARIAVAPRLRMRGMRGVFESAVRGPFVRWLDALNRPPIAGAEELLQAPSPVLDGRGCPALIVP